MTQAVAAAAWVLMLFGPGVALVRLLARSHGWWWALGVGPPVSFGLLSLVSHVAASLGVDPSSAGAVVLGVLCLFGAGLAGRDLLDVRAGWSARHARTSDDRVVSVGGSELLLVLALGSGFALWVAFQAPMLVPAGWDAMHHGFFIRQILDFHTLDTAIVLSSDVSSADAAGSFYPLGFDVAVASLQRVTGLSVSQLMLASTVVAGAMVLPVGTFALARHLGGPRVLVPGFAALACLLVPGLYGIEQSGRLNALVGLALIPGTALALAPFALRRDPAARCPGAWRPSWRALPLAVLAVIGIATVHTSELPTALVLVGTSALVLAVQDRAGRGFVRWFVWAGATGVAAAALLVLADPALLGSAGERSGALVTMTSGAWSAARAIRAALSISGAGGVGAAIDVVGVLVVIGGVLTLGSRWRRFLGPTLAYGIFFVAYVALTTGQGTWIGVLTTPWYRESARLSWNLFVLGAIPVGVAAAAVAGVLRTLVARVQHTWAVDGVALVCGALLLAVGLPPVGPMGIQVADRASPVDADSQKAFDFLAAQVPAGARVLDDLRVDGAMWMYADRRVPTLFGNAPYLGGAPDSWKERLWLRDNLAVAADDPCVPALLAKYRVSHVYFGERGISDGTRHFTLEGLRGSALLTEEFTSGSAHVFRVEPGANPPSCDRDVASSIPWDDNGQ
ncbi:DUF6541 family protein [Pengzhenrongella phosphoraccumulans]|uniref:DUF6541 family protein n=1 Tax=Pengzhenrongella phosphoraccumulans TaxID=3114394 RepID=UPI00388E9DFE